MFYSGHRRRKIDSADVDADSRKFDFQLPSGYLVNGFFDAVWRYRKSALRFLLYVGVLRRQCGSLLLCTCKVGIAYSAVALLILWMGETFPYATEARPYALLMMFFALLLLCWDLATSSQKRYLPLWGAGIANLGMLGAHVFGLFSLLPFLAAEAVRFQRTRKSDPALWAALLLPTVVVALYLPLFHGYEAIYFPPRSRLRCVESPTFTTTPLP